MDISKFRTSIFFALVMFFLFTKEAHAYLDPGTGSFVMQILIAGFLGGVFAIKTFWGNIIGFFTRIFSRDKKTKKSNKKKNNGN